MKRHQINIPTEDGALFGWLHLPDTETSRDTVAVICNPVGYEYAHSHRTVRHLADRLASAGIPALRFDYHGAGDSPGSDLDPNRIHTWKKNIQSAIAYAHAATGREKTSLIGIHLGATLAALVSEETEVNSLILWNPAVSGKRYMREMQVISATASQKKVEETSFIEIAGFQISAETSEQLKQINLLKVDFRVKNRAFVIDRDDLQSDPSFVERFKTLGISVDHSSLPGYAAMMKEPQFTEVPDLALSTITHWLIGQTQEGSRIQFSQTNENDDNSGSPERSFQFGGDINLFGVLNQPETPNDKPVVVMLNAGSVHHVGPNRIYVTLARMLASRGYPSFRIDIQGLGDSAKAGSKKENMPYPDTAVSDTELALDFLKNRLGFRRFILLGLCSGAHTAFHSGIEIKNHEIIDTILINPLTYRWVEGMSLETTALVIQIHEAARYKRTMRDVKSWKKLMTGKVNIRYPLGIFAKQTKKAVSGIFISSDSSQLSQDLNLLFKQGRPLSMFVSSTDPGYNLLLAGARDLTKRALKSGEIRLQFIQNADHTFTDFTPRQELMNCLLEHMNRLSKSAR